MREIMRKLSFFDTVGNVNIIKFTRSIQKHNIKY